MSKKALITYVALAALTAVAAVAYHEANTLRARLD